MLRATSDDWFTFSTNGLSLRELFYRNPGLIYRGGEQYSVEDLNEPDPDASWWLGEHGAGIQGEVRKLALRISPVQDSLNKTWDEQNALLGQGELVPSASDVVDGMIQYYEKSGARIFQDIMVRTSSMLSGDCRTAIGNSGGLITVNCSWDFSVIPTSDCLSVGTYESGRQ